MKYISYYLILPNLLFLIVSRFIFTNRPVVNLDYCLVGIIAPFIGMTLSTILFLLTVLLDVVVSFAPVYHFSLTTLISVFKELFKIQLGYVFTISTLVLLAAIAISLVSSSAEKSTTAIRTAVKTRAALLCTALVLFTFDVANGSNYFRFSDTSLININIAWSASFKMAKAALDVTSTKTRPGSHTTLPDNEHATAGFKLRKNNEHLVLIIVESYGMSLDEKVNIALMSPFRDQKIIERYEIKNGTVPFNGSTVPAELRELCGERAHAPDDIQTECLPKRLRDEGYATVSYHGYQSNFFDRIQWYPTMGFERSYFFEDLRRTLPDQPLFRSVFTGIRDTDIAKLVHTELLTDPTRERKFIYWLTLNSHLPVSPMPLEHSFQCNDFADTRDYSDVCGLQSIIYDTFLSIASIAADPSLPPVHFILVGDHSPPFLLNSRRKLFNSTRVPFFELIPKVSAHKIQHD